MSTASGSALMTMGGTRVICTASVDEEVPRWMRGKGRGWVTAEYGMLPASTGDRKQRDVSKGRADGRTVEIQRLIGRALRGVVDFERLGERTVWIDCDVLEADGGTRCAAITGGFVALELALRGLVEKGLLDAVPLNGSVAAVSCGVVDGTPVLDLDYPEDSNAEVDMNVVMTGDGGLVEVQATGERTPLSRASLDDLLALAAVGNRAPARGAERGRGPCPIERTMRLVLASRNAHKVRELGPLLAPNELIALPDDVELGPEDGATFAENALGKARDGRGRHGPDGRRRRLGDRGRRARRGAGHPLGALRGRARHRRGEPGQAARGGARRTATRGWPTCARWRWCIPVAGEVVVEGRCEGRLTHDTRGRRRIRLRPRLRPRRPLRRAHDGRADSGGEGRDQPPRPRGPGADGAVAPG